MRYILPIQLKKKEKKNWDAACLIKIIFVREKIKNKNMFFFFLLSNAQLEELMCIKIMYYIKQYISIKVNKFYSSNIKI